MQKPRAPRAAIRLGGPGSMPRRKEQFSGFYGAERASTRRLRLSASGLPPFNGSGLKWALSKARPRRKAAVSSLTNGLSCERVTTARSVGRGAGGCFSGREPNLFVGGTPVLVVWDEPMHGIGRPWLLCSHCRGRCRHVYL